jgi:hypothetical protein
MQHSPPTTLTAGLLVSVVLLGGSVAHAQAPTVAASTPEAVVAAAVMARGERYAGDCAGAQSPRDIVALCSRLEGERAGMRAYLIGLAFSEFGWWVVVAQHPDGWRLAGTALLDFLDTSGTIPWP